MAKDYLSDETLTEQQREVQQALQDMRNVQEQQALEAGAKPFASVQETDELQ
jgi:hypothetical protein